MFKKSTKILTLLLSVLLIMSSMSTLNVSAATSFNVPSNGTVVTNTSNTASYTFTNAKETGWYKLALTTQGASTNSTSGKLVFKVTATIGDASWTNGYVINTGKHYPNPGVFYLENGVEYTLDLSFDFSQATETQETISAISFTKQDDIAISSTEDTVLTHKQALAVNHRLNTREDALRSNKGSYDSVSKTCDILPANSGKAIYRVSAATTGMYDIYALEGGRKTAAKFNLYVDDTKITTAHNGDDAAVSTSNTGLTTFTYTKLGRAVLTAGSHNIRAEVTGSDLIYFSGIKLVPVNNEVKTVASTGATEVSFYNDMLFGVSDVNYYEAEYTTYPEEGLSFTSTGYASSGGAIHYASYPINVTKEGLYDISFIGSQQTVNIGVELDGVAHSFANYKTTTPQMTNGSKTLPSGGGQYTAAFKDYVCSIYLTEGIHQIKYKFGTSGYFFAWTIEASKQEISSTEDTYLAGWASLLHHKADGSVIDGYKTLEDGTLKGVYAGHDSEGVVTFRKGTVLYYSVYSDAERTYDLSAIASGKEGTASVKITDAATGNELLSGSAGGDATDGANYVTVEYEVGEITLPQGITTLKFESTAYSGVYFLNAFKLSPVNELTVSVGSAEVMQSEGATETVSIPVNFEGSIDNLAALTVKVAYDEALTFTGYTAGNVVTDMMTPEAKDNKVPLIWVNFPDGEGIAVTSGTLATLQFSVPKTIAKDYEFVVTVEVAAGTDQVNFADTFIKENGKVTVKSTAPIFTFTDGSDAPAVDVVAGTMKLNVDLNDNAKDIVIFAIYADNGEYAVLKRAEEGTITDGVATATISGIELETGVNYYAKAFAWDSVSYCGFVETLGK